MLILISGLPGSGKSTLARQYVTQYGGVHINSDAVRKALGLRGHYRVEEKERVYAVMLENTRTELIGGARVVVDSTFYREAIREPFEALAAELGKPVLRVEVRAVEETIRERLKSARPDSEADFDVYKKIRDQYEPWDEPFLILWSDKEPLNVLAEKLHHYIQTNHDN